MNVQLLNEFATIPCRGSEQAAGFDIAATEGCVVPAGANAVIGMGIAIQTPVGTYGRIAPKSGLAAQKTIHVGAGVVDASLRGEVKVVLSNHGKDNFEVKIWGQNRSINSGENLNSTMHQS